MKPAYFSGFAALAGSAIGGLTSLATSWLIQRTQLREQQHGRDLIRREDLYKNFIAEASKLLADAFEHDQADTSKLVNLYALVSLMRVLSSRRITETADKVVRTIVETYLGPNKTFRDVREIWGNATLDPLREFSSACREELRMSLGRSMRRRPLLRLTGLSRGRVSGIARPRRPPVDERLPQIGMAPRHFSMRISAIVRCSIAAIADDRVERSQAARAAS